MSECHSNEKCCCNCHVQHAEDEKNEKFSWFLEVADEAWTEVLKEEIKKHIWEAQGDCIKELAKIVSEANSNRWKNKMEKKKGCQEFKEKICGFFGQGE